MTRARLLVVPAAVLGLALALSACSGGDTAPSAAPTSTTATPPTAASDPTSTGSPVPTASPTLSAQAATAQKTFDDANRSLAARNGSADDHAVVDGLTAAGFDKQAMQITPDTTTIGRRVDSIEVSVRVGDTCLVGQFRGAAYVGITSPVLSTGKCLLGTTRAIDW